MPRTSVVPVTLFRSGARRPLFAYVRVTFYAVLRCWFSVAVEVDKHFFSDGPSCFVNPSPTCLPVSLFYLTFASLAAIFVVRNVTRVLLVQQTLASTLSRGITCELLHPIPTPPSTPP